MKEPSRPPTRGSERKSRFAAELGALEAFIEETPSTATVKGMYVASLLSMLEKKGAVRPSDKRFFSFKDYPLRDAMRIMLDAAGLLYPDVSPREGLVRLGQQVFPTLTDTTIGKVLDLLLEWDPTTAS